MTTCILYRQRYAADYMIFIENGFCSRDLDIVIQKPPLGWTIVQKTFPNYFRVHFWRSRISAMTDIVYVYISMIYIYTLK